MKPLIGTASLMRRAFASESLESTYHDLLHRLRSNAEDVHAMMDLSIVCQLNGDPSLGLDFQMQALQKCCTYRLKTSRQRSPLRILALQTSGVIMDSMPIEFLLEDPSVQLESLFIGEGVVTPDSLPEHDILVVGICESDAHQDLLDYLTPVLENWPRPVINLPDRIACLARDRFGIVMQNAPSASFANSLRINHHDLVSSACMHELPSPHREQDGWIIRPVSTHAGHGLERVFKQSDFQDYVSRHTALQYFVAPFVDYASPDHLYRKYRIALLDGESFPVHMAISPRWMVHYLNADMLENALHRGEEARFMENYEQGFGSRHRETLREIAAAIGLEYVVLDCAELRDGRLHVFEADNGAVVHSMDPVDVFPYKRPAMQRIFNAFLAMLTTRIQVATIPAAA